MVLHENDYDVSKAINFFFEGGDLSMDWKTVGLKKKQQTSPNLTVDESDAGFQTAGSQNQAPGGRNRNG